MQESGQTFSIQEVSERLQVTTHTLRFWEKKLHGVIVPDRTRGGQRRYTRKHIMLIEEVIKLKNAGLSLRDIRQRLDNENRIAVSGPAIDGIDTMADRIAEIVRSAIYRFLKGDHSG